MIKIKGWNRFLHYHNGKRKVPWIKLYADLLENHDFLTLTESERYQLIALWLLALKLDNSIPEDIGFIKDKINSQTFTGLEKFIKLGFLEIGEVEKEEEIKKETKSEKKERKKREKKEEVNPEVSEFVQKACFLYKEKFGVPYPNNNIPRVVRQIKTNLSEYSLQTLLDFWEKYLNGDYWFDRKTGKSMTIFLNRLAEIVSYKENNQANLKGEIPIEKLLGEERKK